MPQSFDAAILLKLPQSLLDEIAKYAAQNNLSTSACVRIAIADFLGITYQDSLSPEERAAIRAKKHRKAQAAYRERQKVIG